MESFSIDGSALTILHEADKLDFWKNSRFRGFESSMLAEITSITWTETKFWMIHGLVFNDS